MVVLSAKSLVEAIRQTVRSGIRAAGTQKSQSSQPVNLARSAIRLSAQSKSIPPPIQPSTKLNYKFTQLFHQLSFNPVFRGAKNVFLSSSRHLNQSPHSAANSPILRNLARANPSFKSGFNSSNRFRVSTIPIRQSTCHGPGLQTARNFSSGQRTLDLVITNAPLALRALGNELEKKSSISKENQSRGIRRLGFKGVKKTQRLALQRSMTSSSKSSPSSANLSSNCAPIQSDPVLKERNINSSVEIIPSLSCKEEIRNEFEHYWKPIPNSSIQGKAGEGEGPHEGLETTLHLALDPNLSSILIRKPFNSDPSSSSSSSSSSDYDLLDQSFLDSLKDIKDSFRDHKVFLSRILKTLRELKIMNSYDPWRLSFENFESDYKGRNDAADSSSHPNEAGINPSSFSLEIKFKGWKKEEILDMLRMRIGSELIQEFENLMLFVEKSDKSNLAEYEVTQSNSVSAPKQTVTQALNQTRDSKGRKGSDHSKDSISFSESDFTWQSFHQIQNDSHPNPSETSEWSQVNEEGLDEFSSTLIMPQIPIQGDDSIQTIRQDQHPQSFSPLSSVLSNSSSPSTSTSNSVLSSPRSDLSSLIDSVEFELDFELEGMDELEHDLEDSRIGF